jgi:phage terminase large subunit GpA-like protein
MEETLFLGHRTRYSLEGPPWMGYLRGIIDHPGRKKIILAGRQVGKSAMCAGEACAEIVCENDFTVLYGTVDNNKLKNFTNQKLDPMVTNSPLIRRHFLSGKTVKDNVTDKRFSNGSMIMVRNAK